MLKSKNIFSVLFGQKRRTMSFLEPQKMLTISSEVDLRAWRKTYSQHADKPFDVTNLVSKDPFAQFDTWFKNAAQQDMSFEEKNAVALSTVNKNGRPSCRMVLLKGYGRDGFRFFTNCISRKGKELAENPYACMTAYWPALNQQVRIEGIVERLPADVVDEYWRMRPIGSQISASASEQSSVVASREALEERVQEITERFAKAGEIPRPPEWGGYILVPDMYEFWQGHVNRLHDRIRFRKPVENEVLDEKMTHRGDNGWVYERLAP